MPASAVAALDLRLVRRAESPLPGEHLGSGVGDGTELAQIRPYLVGDDVRRLDAAASARTGEPQVRQQVPDRALTTWLVLDRSPSMAFGTADRLKSDVADGVASVVARLAIRRGGRIGMLTFGAPVTRMLPPRGGRGARGPVARVLTEGVAPDGHDEPQALREVLERLVKLARRPGLVVVVSDFREDSNWARPLGMLGARTRVVAVEVADPREHDLPDAGMLAVVDPETGELVEVDTSASRLRAEFAAAERERREALAARLRRGRARHVELSTAGDWLRELGRGLR